MNIDPLDVFLTALRSVRPESRDVPGFDPRNGNLNAKFLLVLEAPGPGAVASGFVSIENEDPTAKNLKKLLADSSISPDEIVIWNVVPWYCGNEEKTKIQPPSTQEMEIGIDFLCKLVLLLKNLEAIVLVGGSARKAHIRLSAKTRVRILSCHHPSQRVINVSKSAMIENQAVFAFLRATTA
jgi:uracil-DNA glycosylase